MTGLRGNLKNFGKKPLEPYWGRSPLGIGKYHTCAAIFIVRLGGGWKRGEMKIASE